MTLPYMESDPSSLQLRTVSDDWQWLSRVFRYDFSLSWMEIPEI